MMYQQGDVILLSTTIPETATKKTAKNNKYVLAEGEVTGHMHAIHDVNACELFENNNDMYLRVLNESTTLTHEEHHKINIPTGDYIVRIVKEYDHFAEEAKKVVD
jgi:hypothetical protein